MFSHQQEIDTLSSRLIKGYLTREINLDVIAKDIESMQPDGSWADVDYTNVTLYFPAGKHLERLVSMAIAYRKAGLKYSGLEELYEKILAGIDYFFTKKPSSTNWWYIDIGAPQEYMIVLLLLKSKMDKKTLLHYSSYLEDRTSNPEHGGKNRTWVSAITIHKGCIEDNYNLIEIGFKSIASTIVIEHVQGVEGIKPDYSFHQHRPQLYSGGYGMGTMSDLSQYIMLAHGLSFEKLFTMEKIKILSKVLLEGHQLLGYRRTFDFGAIGRNIGRPNSGKNISPQILRQMQIIDPVNANAYQKWEEHINGAPFAVMGNKYFWKSDIMTHHGANYYMSAKIISTRTNGTEMLNGENLKGYYLPLGSTNILTTGNEYKNIFAVWDWTRVPGTTSVRNQSSALLRWYFFGSNTFAGGVSNSKNGVIAYEHSYNGVQAKKSYFFIGDAMLCMGSGITACKTQEVITSVNQCIHQGDITFSQSDIVGKLTKTKCTLDDVNWVYHDNVGYLFPKGGKLTIQQMKQSGSWREISESQIDELVEHDVFSLWISHGRTPVDDSYAYIVMPDKPLSYFESGSINHGFEIIKNTAAIQAVKNSIYNSYAIIFYESGTVDMGDGLTVTSDAKGMVYIEKTPESYNISVSDPVYSQKAINITLNNKTIHLDFPQGDYQGSTATYSYKL